MRLPIQVLVYPIHQAGSDWEYLLLHRVGGRGAFWQGVTGAPFEGECWFVFLPIDGRLR